MFSSYKYVTYLFIMQMINLFPTSTDTKWTTFDIITSGEVWLQKISTTPPLFCIEMSVPYRKKVNGHVIVFEISVIFRSIIFLFEFGTIFYENKIVKPYQTSQSAILPINIAI